MHVTISVTKRYLLLLLLYVLLSNRRTGKCSHTQHQASNATPDHGRRHVDALGVRPAGHGTRAAAQGSSQVAWDGLARGAAEDVRGRALIHKLREAH